MSKTFFPILSTMKRTLLSLCDQAKPLWLHHILVFFGNMHCLLSKNFFEPQKKNVSYESHSNSTMKSLLHVQLIYNSHFDFLVLQFTCCHLATVLCFVWETSFWKVIHLCLCFLFFFFFHKLNFSTRMMMFCHFSQFPPERFLYLNVGLISLDVWLVDKIYFIFNFFELCFYLHLNKVWQTRDMILGKPWLSMKINSVKKQELRWTLILIHFFLFSVD